MAYLPLAHRPFEFLHACVHTYIPIRDVVCDVTPTRIMTRRLIFIFNTSNPPSPSPASPCPMGPGAVPGFPFLYSKTFLVVGA